MKKIVHMCMTAFTDEMAYQENLLAKYHVKLGYKVTVITSTWRYNTNGKLEETDKCDYINQDMVHVRRLALKGKNDITRKFRKFENVYEVLCEESPDILFVHGCQYMDISVITQYIKNFRMNQVYVDNHADFSNSATNWLSKNVLHKIIWRHYAHMIEPYTRKFYGVLPARVDFLIDVYKLPKEKCEFLMLGADDELVENAKNNMKETRKKYRIDEKEFVIVTGGKINFGKRQVIFLQKAIQKLNKKAVRLIIFGSIEEDMKSEIISNCNCNISYVGWLSSKETHDLIAVADLAVYPGGHSTLWEQTVGQGIPLLINFWGGVCEGEMRENAEYLYQSTEEEIYNKVGTIISNKDKYYQMANAAKKYQKDFLYGNIAQRCINREKTSD